MPRFPADDGTALAYRTVGDGPLLVCLPGGPGQDSRYLGDLGGLSAWRTLVLLDNRGTGDSDAPADPTSYRVDRLVDDVEALRRELGLARISLLGHSAGGGPALLHAAAHPDRVDRLVLANPSLRVLGLASDAGAEEIRERRAGEPWYAGALAALEAARAAPTFEEAVARALPAAPLGYGPWGAAAQAHAAVAPSQYRRAAHEGFYAGFTPDPAIPSRLAALTARVLVLGGEHDLWPTRHALRDLTALLPGAELIVQPGAGHFPWVDDPATFSRTVAAFLLAS